MKLFKFLLAFWIKPISVFYAYVDSDASSKIQQLYIGQQTGKGLDYFTTTHAGVTPADPVAGDAVQQYELELPNPEGENLTREGSRRVMTPMPSRPGGRTLATNFKTDLVIYQTQTALQAALDNPTVPTNPPLAALLRACDLYPNNALLTSTIVTPSTNRSELLSTYQVSDGRVHKSIDCKSGFKFVGNAPGLYYFQWGLNGRFNSYIQSFTELDIDTSFYDAKVIDVATTIQFIVDPDGTPVTYDIDFANFELDWSPTIVHRKGHRGVNGLKDAMFSGREPTFTLDPEMSSANDAALINAWDAGTPVRVTYKTAESPLPRFEMIINGELDKAGFKDDEGELRHDLNIRLCSEGEDDELRFDWKTTADA